MAAALGRVLCSRGHLHANRGSAAVCEAAWRSVEARRLGIGELVKDLREVLARNEERRRKRALPTGRR